MLEDGTVFEKKGYDGGEPLEFITDEGKSTLSFNVIYYVTQQKCQPSILTE